MEKMKGDRELEKLLSEIPSPQSISSSTQYHHYHHGLMGLNPGSSSYMNVGDDGSSSLSSYEYHLADIDRFYGRNNNGGCVVVDELGLTGDFQKMNLEDRNNNGACTNSRRFVVEAEGFKTTSEPNPNPNPIVARRTPSFHADPTMTRYVLAHNNNNNNYYCNYYNNNSNTVASSVNVNANAVGVDPLLESSYFDHASNDSIYSNSPSSYYYNSCYPTKNDHYRSSGAGPYHRSCSPFADHPLQHCKVDPKNLSMYNNNNKPDALLHQCGININSSDLIHPKHAFTVENATALYNPPPPHFKPRMRAEDPLAMTMGENRGLFPQSYVFMKTAKKLDTTNHGAMEDAYILEERPPKYDPSSRVRVRNCHSGTPLQFIGDNNNKTLEFNGLLHPGERICENGMSFVNCHPIVLQPTFNSASDVQGNIYLIARDQHGCRFLQKKFEEGSYEDVELIFNEIIDHVVELMMNPFGNYLIQKLLDVCHEVQRMRIVHMVTREPGQLVRISLNTHGTRVVQKLIETLSTQEQISLVVLALEPGFLDLIKDLNGNHVIQRCLQCLRTEDNKFIFDAAAKFCVDIATHRHGCCVLQRCIDYSNGEQRQKLIAEICVNGLLLAQDPFGNYVVQYILEKKISSASAQLVTQFEEHFVHLSMQKFSSHVVEKCLKFYEESRHVIVHELLSVSHFEQVLQDQYANYVIQSALDVTKGPLHDLLVAAVRPHTILRTNPYCKKIFSRGLLKK